MSPALTVFLLFTGWLAVAAAMLWGVMRISRRHHHPESHVEPAPKSPPAKSAVGAANTPM
ncbi:hypothetical protein SAMN04490203_1776 [Pseudomonas taetrolens]|uniref:Uncharacterized protein n=1 Tax=Pseudomonas taetrolens TaxID=47884 RepID=A0A0J6GMQ3_PSETA|nr:hypothetical protein [Pseudomonas taetrolens]KMM82875.1 hypothetical protein TU78_19670 [Pseudomonas taetrolens]SEC09001.1 hypothetical protein SAMN04490203_1776 [Pseudomonas taetrolens]SQF85934.1 Uncharacterised protein [Pseudomonas taetrolens]VEH49011.1 Uncharacterised protein [Pseudomonas taetrolens]